MCFHDFLPENLQEKEKVYYENRLGIGAPAKQYRLRYGAEWRKCGKPGLPQGRQPPEVNYVYGDAQVARATS